MHPDTTPATTHAGQEPARANGADRPFTPLDAARLYHAHHLVPIPWRAVNGRKTPTIKAWNDPRRRLPLDRLLSEFTRPGTQIGLATGESHLVVVDVDVKGTTPGDPRPFVGTTPCVARTPSGGWHFFYQRDTDDPIPSRAGVLPGVDVRADDGYVAVWPSAGYRWEERGALSTLLAGVLPGFSAVRHLLVAAEAAQREDRGIPTEPWIARALSAPVPIGEQRQTITRLAGYFIKHRVQVDIIVATLWPRVQSWLQRTDDPWTETQVQEIIEDLLVKERAQARGTAAADGERFRAVPFAERFRAWQSSAGEVEWIAEGWLPTRALALLGGPSQIGKTLLAVHLSVAVATGRPFLGTHHAQQGRVLYVTAEDEASLLTARLVRAYRGVVGPEPEGEISADKSSMTIYAPVLPPPDFPVDTYVGNAFRFGSDELEAEFEAEVRRVRPVLVILDPLKDLVTGQALSDYFTPVVRRLPVLRRLRDDLGCSFLLITHTNKNPDLQGDDAALWGGTLVTASFDTRWIAREVPRPATDRLAMLIRRKLKIGSRPPLVYFEHGADEARFVFEFTSREVSEKEAQTLGARALDERDEEILTAVRKQQPISVNALSKTLDNRAGSLSTIQARVKALVRDGRLVEDEGKRIKVPPRSRSGRSA